MKKELSMLQWESHQFWEERCADCGWTAGKKPQQSPALLTEQLRSFHQRLHDADRRSWCFSSRPLPTELRSGTPKSRRRRLGRSPSEGDAHAQVNKSGGCEDGAGTEPSSTPKAKVSSLKVLRSKSAVREDGAGTGPSSTLKVLGSKSGCPQNGAGASTEPALPPKAVSFAPQPGKGKPALPQLLNLASQSSQRALDCTSEVSRFLRQHRHLPQARRVLDLLPDFQARSLAI
ncbi:hypothetical protein AK812_SmicGene15137 [Symbiodinium microadriaticum]|uniref:Uncharacterized protein n=1 Tax=Symbiodinium microadriaticum TaxID=2951 RepID=A0A1Q9E3T7_SYMMI|nr:hypothetical protein AK812_SmicGene15137 [Symbiodinium microadriaticum]